MGPVDDGVDLIVSIRVVYLCQNTTSGHDVGDCLRASMVHAQAAGRTDIVMRDAVLSSECEQLCPK